MSESEQKVLNPTVIKLGLVSLFADISSEMLYPITPLFLTTVLGASMTSVGVIEGMAEATASLLKTFSGAWSDKILRRKPFIVVGYLLTAIAKPFIGFAHSWTAVLFARVLDRTGKGIRTAPRDALLSEAVVPGKRGAAFGWHRGMDTLGATVGPLLALGYLSFLSNDLRRIYFYAFIPGMLSVLTALTIGEAKSNTHSRPQSKAVGKKASMFSLKGFDRQFKYYVLSWFIFSLANSSDVFLLMKAKSSGMGASQIILVYCFYNLFYALLSPVLGHLSDRIGKKILLVAGLGLFSLIYLGFGFAQAPWQFWFLFFLYGVFMAATDGVGKAFAVDLVASDKKATGLGVMGTFTGVAMLCASSAAGFLWDHVSPTAPFVFGAAGALISMLLMLFV